MKILCKTLFDCSRTGVVGHYRPSQVPFQDNAGRTITDLDSWLYSRNQQRNWETIMQIVSLRAQPMEVGMTKVVDNIWQFNFTVESSGVYSKTADPDNLDVLLMECHGIPMVVGLQESSVLEPKLISSGPDQNIWFETVNN